MKGSFSFRIMLPQWGSSDGLQQDMIELQLAFDLLYILLQT
jgi:hypothetical protein